MQLLAYLQLIRAPNGITALTNIIAASMIASAGIIEWSALGLLCLSSLCFYYAGMALNDCLDVKEDRLERPTRPLPSGLVSLASAYGLVALLCLVGLFSAYCHSLQSLFVATGLLFTIIVYDAVIKRGMPGAFAMGACRYFNWLLGLSILPLSAYSWLIPLPIFFYIAALTFLSKQETHAREPNSMALVAVLLGFSVSSVVACLFVLFGFSLLNLVALLCLVSAIVYRLLNTFRHFTPEQIQATVTWMIIGIIPLDALLVFFAGHYVVAAGLLVLIWPCRLLSKKLYMT